MTDRLEEGLVRNGYYIDGETRKLISDSQAKQKAGDLQRSQLTGPGFTYTDEQIAKFQEQREKRKLNVANAKKGNTTT